MKLRYDKYSYTKREILLFLLQTCCLTAVVDILFYKKAAALFLAVPIGVFYWHYQKREKLRRLRQKLHYHFKDCIGALHTAIRTGYSLESALKESYQELLSTYGKEDVMVQELYAMCNQLKLKVPVEELFTDMGRRSRIEDIENFAQVVQIAKRTGGRMEAILQDIWLILSGKIETKQEIDAVIAAKKYEQTIMSIMPAGIILYLQVSFPELLTPMYQTTMGIGVMSGCLVVYGAAYYLGIRIVEIEV